MKVLNKLTIKSLKLNKKRTIVTIIGIMLSTALICGVAGLVSSFQKTLINWTIREYGDFHTTFYDVPKDKTKYITENEKVEKYFYTDEIGWAKLEGSKNESKPYLHVLEYDKTALENYGVYLLEGRLPTNSNEILISEHILTNARVNLKVGDMITIDIGKRVLQDGTVLNEENPYLTDMEEDGIILEESIVNTESKTYTIVGVIERPSKEEYSSPGYTVITYMEDIGDTPDIAALYKNPKEYKEINESICSSTGVEKIESNTDLLRYQGVLNDATLQVLYTIGTVVIVIIVVSSVFVIRNSFSISVAEKNRQYGMLASVGATSKQIKKNVLFEGLSIGLIAIPLGILLGIVAIMILLQVVNYLLSDMFVAGLNLEYSISIIPIIASVIISLITIYLSCLIPAIRASKISPIESIRGNNDIKLKPRKIKTPKFIKKVFGIGGVIASKNLKRSKKKYRTTVISIVVSIFIFISLSSILTLGTKVTTLYYTDFKFNIFVSGGDKTIYEEIAKLDNVDNYAYFYEKGLDINFEKYSSEFGKQVLGDVENGGILLAVYNNEYFKQYIKELGISEENYKKAAILIDDVILYNADNTRTVDRIYNIQSGDEITITDSSKEKNFVITKTTTERPMGLENTYYDSGIIVVSQDFLEEVFGEKLDETYILDDLLIYSEEDEILENTINDLIKQNENYSELAVYNYNTAVEQQKRIILVVAIFLYGFITVISLIGVTNIFNTITTNMILRSKEFAMLKSIGMTKKEFNRMIRLESIMYGLKALIIGIPLGILGSYFIYKAFALDTDFGYSLPIVPIIISIVFVFIIVGITMKYSLNKINKQNIIETIRKDNI